MKLKVSKRCPALDDLTEAVESLTAAERDQTAAIREQTAVLQQIADALTPKKATALAGTVVDIPRTGETPPPEEDEMVNFGTKPYDKLAGIRCRVSANGPIDPKPPTWSFVATATQTDGSQAPVDGVTQTVAADGLSAEYLVPETQIDVFQATCVAEVDDPNTEGIETISEVFSGAFSHSKATTLTGSVDDIPR